MRTLTTNSSQSHLLQDLSKAFLVQRLKHITLSAVPSWLGPRVATASRFQHSLAVGKLSFLVSGGSSHDRLLLTAASALHDVGDGPFPHISDQSMKELLGFTHEGGVRFAFDHSPMEDRRVLGKHGLDLDEICLVLENHHRLSPLLYGFPDLDNADNIYRFMMTIPGKPLDEASYRPSEIASSMSLDSENQSIPNDLKKRWASDFEKVYSYVWNDRHNMVCWTMLGRAFRILKENMTPDFFRFTNREAFVVMQHKLPEWARGLKQNMFKILIDKKYTQLKGEAQKLSMPTELIRIEHEICTETGLEEWSIGLTVDQPLLREKPDHWRVFLVSYKGNAKPLALLEDLLSSSIPFSDN